ncbi:MAG TPA: CRISPR-associated endoribonuclease Cas6 [Candidatus Brocadiaceae bacterium]
MRIKITLSAHKSAIVDFNYQHQIQALIYEFLSRSNPDYAQWLHQQGFVYKRDKRFKFFVFSGILFHGPIKLRTTHATHPGSWNGLSGLNGLNSSNGFLFHASQANPFTFSFCIASPVDTFIQHLIEGIFSEGQEVRLGKNTFCVHRIETLPEPLDDLNRLNCLNGLNGLIGLSRLITITFRPLESPIFVKKPMPPGQQDIFLFPGDKEYEDLLNQNLKDKYETLYGKPYESEMLTFDFHTIKGKSVKHFTVFKKGMDGSLRAVNIKGTLQPFTVTGTKELIQIGLECGFGQNNSMGCGYVEVAQTVETVQAV